jgi:type IV secretory pathway TraG/TraD family ATPase VirD4
MLLADSGRDGHLWNTLATNRARAALNLLWFFPEHYTLPAVYRFIFQKGFQEDILARIDRERSEREEALKTERDPVKIDVLETEKRTIETALQEVANADDLDAKIRQSVETQLTSVLSNMMAPEIEDAFFSAGAPALDLSSTYEDGTIFVINAEIKSYGLAAAAILALTKLMFFDAMEARRNAPSANKDRPVAYICDEVQDVLTCSEDGRGDQSFFAKARDTKTMCVLATQNLKGLIAKVGEDMAMTVVASMRTRLAFRTEDDTTIENTLKLLGKTEVERESSSSTKNPGQWAKSKGTSVQTVRERIADEELFRNLDEFQAVLIGSIGNRSADDVITCTPEYVS